MRKAIGFIVLFLAGSFLLLDVSYGQERGKGNLSVLAKRMTVLDRRKLLLQSPTRHTIFWNKPGHLVFPLYAGREGCGLPAKIWGYAKWSWHGGELCRSFSSDEYLLPRGNVEKKRGRAMGIGEQTVVAYAGGFVGGILGMCVTWGIIKLFGEDVSKGGLERAGWAAIALKVGCTIGVPIRSATWLHIQGDRSFQYTLLGAVVPTIFITTADLIITAGNPLSPPYILLVGWVLAPIGAVIGYNLAD